MARLRAAASSASRPPGAARLLEVSATSSRQPARGPLAASPGRSCRPRPASAAGRRRARASRRSRPRAAARGTGGCRGSPGRPSGGRGPLGGGAGAQQTGRPRRPHPATSRRRLEPFARRPASARRRSPWPLPESARWRRRGAPAGRPSPRRRRPRDRGRSSARRRRPGRPRRSRGRATVRSKLKVAAMQRSVEWQAAGLSEYRSRTTSSTRAATSSGSSWAMTIARDSVLRPCLYSVLRRDKLTCIR